MFSERDRETHIRHYQQLLIRADNAVWSKPNFPQEHRPDVPFLQRKITIGEHPTSEQIPHPEMRGELLKQVNEELNRRRADYKRNKVAWYVVRTREIVVNQNSLGVPEGFSQRFIWHQAARDIANRAEFINPDNYPPDYMEKVPALLDQAFSEDKRPDIKDTRVFKTGFRRTLFIGNYAVSELLGPQIITIDEVYPTVFEIITEQLLENYDGDTERLEREAVRGLVTPTRTEDHLKFASMLFLEMKYINWRAILSAFKTGDIHSAVAILEQNAVQPDMGAGLYLELVDAMERDEKFISKVNAAYTQYPFSLS